MRNDLLKNIKKVVYEEERDSEPELEEEYSAEEIEEEPEIKTPRKKKEKITFLII